MNLTQSARKANLKRWKAQKPAVIDSPLKAIHDRYPDQRVLDETTHHFMYARALNAAKRGDGITVKQMARAL